MIKFYLRNLDKPKGVNIVLTKQNHQHLLMFNIEKNNNNK